jgi:hypothetical protein
MVMSIIFFILNTNERTVESSTYLTEAILEGRSAKLYPQKSNTRENRSSNRNEEPKHTLLSSSRANPALDMLFLQLTNKPAQKISKKATFKENALYLANMHIDLLDTLWVILVFPKEIQMMTAHINDDRDNTIVILGVRHFAIAGHLGSHTVGLRHRHTSRLPGIQIAVRVHNIANVVQSVTAAVRVLHPDRPLVMLGGQAVKATGCVVGAIGKGPIDDGIQGVATRLVRRPV